MRVKYDYATRIESKNMVVDGNRLTEFIIDNGSGVATGDSSEIKNIDQYYFIED